MYIPQHFQQREMAELQALMQAHPLATLVTMSAAGLPEANHIPLHFTPGEGTAPEALGVLRGHVAKANTLWREHPADAPVLAIFHGPQAYITPSWYPTKQETGKAVPTWNYAAVHAQGRLRTIDAVTDAAWLRTHLQHLTAHNEAGFDHPWQVNDAPADYIDKMLRAIVGIEITITALQGKWKVSQNQPEPNQQGVAAGLRVLTGVAAPHAMAALVEHAASQS